MITFFNSLVISAILLFNIVACGAAELIHHSIFAEIDHDNSFISVSDTITNYKNLIVESSLRLILNQELKVSMADSHKIDVKPTFLVNKSIRKNAVIISLTEEELNGKKPIIINYSGKLIPKTTEANKAEFARAGTDYDFLLNSDGAFLSAMSNWFPDLNTELFTFDLTLKSEKSYQFVSQGDLVYNKLENDKRISRFECKMPMDDIYIISAKYFTFEEKFGDVLVQAYLLQNDKELAEKYINATEDFLKMYNELIGKYPYSRFTMAENKLQTGWGMPSFTLLGSQIIRFPFILMSSYPHELLHNWWGNSVYVDYKHGNWCEGLTSYLADHLIKEIEGVGSEYRKDALKRYTFYVPNGLDKSVETFKTKENDLTEAIGYGKVLMIFHSLRIKYGDDIFKKFIQDFYAKYKFKKVNFVELFDLYAQYAEFNSEEFFNQWIRRSGVPTIELLNPDVNSINGKFVLSFELNQSQPNQIYNIDVPVYVKLEGKDTLWHQLVNNDSQNQLYSFSFDEKPLEILIDPLYDVMRRLLPGETAPTLASIFGAPKSSIVLPKNSKNYASYKKLAEAWQESQQVQNKILLIFDDSDLEELPHDYPTWIIGKDNKFFNNKTLSTELTSLSDETTISDILNSMDKHSAVAVISNPANAENALGYFNAVSDIAIASLARKLPHYGKYSYLGFKSDKAENNLKGVFNVKDNPLFYTFEPQKFATKVPEHKPLIIMNP